MRVSYSEERTSEGSSRRTVGALEKRATAVLATAVLATAVAGDCAAFQADARASGARSSERENMSAMVVK